MGNEYVCRPVGASIDAATPAEWDALKLTREEKPVARTPEGKVKDQVVRMLKAYGAYYFSPATGGYGKSGVPDIIACLGGRFIGVECKAGKNEPTALQLRNLEDIDRSGGVALVVNEHNLTDLQSILEDNRCPT